METVLATHSGSVGVDVSVFGELDFSRDGGLVAGSNEMVVEMKAETIAGELGGREAADKAEGPRGKAVLDADGSKNRRVRDFYGGRNGGNVLEIHGG